MMLKLTKIRGYMVRNYPERPSSIWVEKSIPGERIQHDVTFEEAAQLPHILYHGWLP